MRQDSRQPIRRRIRAVGMAAVFLAMVSGIGAASALMPKRTISELEKRRLADPPALTLHALQNGSFASDLQDYAQDHIAWRDAWIDLYSDLETTLFGRNDVNGILLGQDGWMFAEHFELSDQDREQFARNLDEVERFAERYADRVTLLLVPPAEMIYSDKLPQGAPQRDLNALLDEADSRLAGKCRVIDLREAFGSAREHTALYYRSDHHWTADGAYLAYEAFCEQNGLAPFDPQAHTRVDVPGFLGTHYTRSRWRQAREETLSYYDTGCTMTVMDVLNENDYKAGDAQPLVNEETLKTVDKYGAFLDGNHGYVEITGAGEGGILLVKDSYANSLAPYLTENYGLIGCVDFREFSFGLDTTIASREYDQILILYGMDNFLEDTRLVYLNRPSVLL